MTWKDVIIFSILVLGFTVVILSIILNDKMPMYIFPGYISCRIIEHYSGTTGVSLDKESVK